MDRATEIRGKIMTALSGLKYSNTSNTSIPVFDEVVNPAVTLPAVGGAQEVYVVLQDQQEQYAAVQTVCNPRFELSVTIRVVTKWGKVGKKKLCEDIGDTIINLLRDDRGASKIDGIDKVLLVTAQSIAETTINNVAFSKIIILNFIKNG